MAFVQSMTSILKSEEPAEVLDNRFVANFFSFGSRTPDNLQCIERLGIVDIRRPDQPNGIGLGLRGKKISVADVLNAAEGVPLPRSVTDQLPELSQEDWDAVLRLTTLFFAALESNTTTA